MPLHRIKLEVEENIQEAEGRVHGMNHRVGHFSKKGEALCCFLLYGDGMVPWVAVNYHCLSFKFVSFHFVFETE